MKTALGEILARAGDLRVLAAALEEADRGARLARSAADAVLVHFPDSGVRAAATRAAEREIATRRDLRRRNIAHEMRRIGARLVALAVQAEADLGALSLRIERDPACLVAEAALFDTPVAVVAPAQTAEVPA